MYVYTYVCMYVCMHVALLPWLTREQYMYLSVYVCMYVCSICMYCTYINPHIHQSTHTYAIIWNIVESNVVSCIYACIVHTYVSYIHTFTHTHTIIWNQVGLTYTYKHVYIYTCIHMLTHLC